jgi:Phosphotransferase enzyme family
MTRGSLLATVVLSPTVERRLEADLSFAVVRAEPIEPWQAHNNQLQHVWSADGREAVVKTYYQDDRYRLDREFTALVFLRANGILDLPKPLLRDDEHHFAVYSFEAGATAPGSSLTAGAVARIAEFAAKLHGIGPGTPGAEHFRTSVPATFSLADMARGTRARLAQFMAHAASINHPSLAHTDWHAEIETLIGEALRGAEDTPIPKTDWRFSTADFAPHNILVSDGDRICVVDLEYSGWDDPLMPAADFLAAETSTSLRAACVETFVRTYADCLRLSPRELARLSRMRALMEIGWIAVHLSLLAPERIAPKRFADPAHFDAAAHIARHAALAEARLARAKALLPSLLHA